MARVVCVAEKPAIAKTVAQHLSGGRYQTHSIRGSPYVKNYEFDFEFNGPWGNSSVTMTSVVGHLGQLDFQATYRSWASTPPQTLFEAPVVSIIPKEQEPIARNLQSLARRAHVLFIWTDCDREGEHIGTEVRKQFLSVNPRIEFKRARFNNTERAHVIRAAQNPVELDEKQANAVAARMELDLRIGAAFTRLQTLRLNTLGGPLENKIISYGSCQFPTLGFVVDRYCRVKNFKPEPFWSIKVTHRKENISVNFAWDRNHLFDRAATTILFERCLDAKVAKVTTISKKPTSKWRPLPLTTVDLQMMGSRYLRMDSSTVMKVAESLYTRGFISYPRTETDQFDKGIDLKKLIERQLNDDHWGTYARGLLGGNFRNPRVGRHNDKAHPPIHPVAWVARSQLKAEEWRVYEFVVRRFLACCSDDAKGEATDISIEYGPEFFHAHGLLVREKNYLEVYVYEKWESSTQLPPYDVGETFRPTEAIITEGKTTAPGYLTEPELIGLMDANGIGTDATMADHIATIKKREYVATRKRGGGRGGNSVDEFIPTQLGVALVEGYDNVVKGIADSPSLSKPHLRKEMELHMREICSGSKSKTDVVQFNLTKYREVFLHTQRRIDALKDACRKYMFQPN
ncbi:DNA topoisomerase [Ascosphaera aggregata]|nr:DNA topoisomerase [Ascosphaera aggregata]